MLDDTRLVIGLSSVALGWLLAQFTGVFKDWHRTRKIKRCLIEELDELKTELNRTLLIYTRQLQIYAKNGIGNESPSPLSNHIFKNYYKDAVLGLNTQQRISMQLIHTLVDVVNAGIDEFRLMTDKLQEKRMDEDAEDITEKDVEMWGQRIKCEYTNVATVIWHIRLHLTQPKKPDLSLFAESHKLYLQYLASVKSEISKIIEGAATIDRKDFENIYDVRKFP
jgi:hypothetical protein